MARNLDPKCKQCRREGVKLFLKGDKCFSIACPMLKRDYAPGVHGPASKKGRKKRISSYGIQLREKQKAKRTYRLMERQFKLYFTKASKMPGDTSENLLQILELRLDNLVYRLGFATSRDLARQLVTHGHITIDGKKAIIPSIQIKVGQKISVSATANDKAYWKTQLPKLAKVEIPSWLALDSAKHEGQLVSVPTRQDLPISFDPTMIVEFYSR